MTAKRTTHQEPSVHHVTNGSRLAAKWSTSQCVPIGNNVCLHISNVTVVLEKNVKNFSYVSFRRHLYSSSSKTMSILCK